MTLETAVRLDPADAVLWNQLSVALLEARLEGDRSDLVHVVGAATKALDLDPSSAAARYNFALGVDRLLPSVLAANAWQRYLELDSQSDWAETARQHLAALLWPAEDKLWARARVDLAHAADTSEGRRVARLVARFPQQARLFSEGVLAEWGHLTSTGNTLAATRELNRAKEIGASLLQATSDRLIADSVSAITRADTASEIERLASGHLGIRAAEQDPSAARPRLNQSATQLAEAGSPFAGWAVYHSAVRSFHDADYPATTKLLRSILTSPALHRYPSLAAKSHWLMGLTHVVQGELTDSLENYFDARDQFALTGERENLAVIDLLLAQNFRYLGDIHQYWIRLEAATDAARWIVDPKRMQFLLEENSEACLLLSEPSVALLFQTALVDMLSSAGDPILLAQALQKRSQTYQRAGDHAAAKADLEGALRQVSRIPKGADRETVLGDVLVARGRLSMGSDLPRAFQSFTNAIRLYRKTSYWRPLPALLLKRAMVSKARGDVHLAESDLLAAAAEIEKQQQSLIDQPMHRALFFNEASAIFENLVALAVDEGDLERALELAEQGKARALTDLVSGSRTREGGANSGGWLVAAIQRELPERTALIEYAVLEDRLVTWLVRQDRFRGLETEMSSVDLESLVGRFREAILHADHKEFIAAAGDLHRVLVKPFAEDLQGVSSIVFVPDRILHRLPFSALMDGSSRQFLVESYAIGKMPSSSLFAFSARSEERPIADPRSVLVVANPAFDRRKFPWLDPLPESELEARRIAELLPGAHLLAGEAATKRAFIASAGDYSIVHVAGHTIDNSRVPSEAGLLFASSSGSSESPVLTVREVERTPFPSTSLVILATCESAGGHLLASDGPISPARAFLAAGVRSVVSSQWRVDDGETASFLTRFYRRLEQGVSPRQALRQAQIEMLAGSGGGAVRAVRIWAAWEWLGTS